MPIDRGPSRRAEDQAELGQPGIQGVVVSGGE
jgi:hypothetical protein